MQTVNFEVDLPDKFSSKEKEIFCEMLLKQGKVKNPSIDKLNNCKILCVCLVHTCIYILCQQQVPAPARRPFCFIITHRLPEGANFYLAH